MQPLEFKYSEVTDVPCGDLTKWQYESIVASNLLKVAIQNERYFHFTYDGEIGLETDPVRNVPTQFLQYAHVVDVVLDDGSVVRVKDRIGPVA